MRPVIAAANLENLSAERNPPSIYGKDPNRPGPVDMILKPDLLLERANSNPKIKIDSPTISVFPFGKVPKGETNTANAKVKWPSAKYELRWDSLAEKWLIYFNEKPNLAASGEHLFADTAIIQIVSITPSIYGDKFGEITPFSKTTGTGKAVMLRDGFSYQISWQRDSETELTRWQTIDEWNELFLHRALGKIWKTLKKGGTLIVNIADVYASSKGTDKGYRAITTPMNEFLEKQEGAEYLGCIGMEMAKRPGSAGAGAIIEGDEDRYTEEALEKAREAADKTFCEPMWVWRKN